MLVTTPAQFDDAMIRIRQHDFIDLDTETDGVDWAKDNKVVGVPLLAGDDSYYFSFRHKEGPNLPESYLCALAEELSKPGRTFGMFHGAFDIKMMSKEGMRRPDKFNDSMLSAHLLNENEPSFKMEELATKYVDPEAGKAEEALVDILVARFGGSRKTAKKNLHRLPAEIVHSYGEQDVRTTRNLRELHAPHLERWKLSTIANEIFEFQLLVCDMELRGIQLDVTRVRELMAEAEVRENEFRDKLHELAGYKMNPRSSKQVNAWLGVTSSSKQALVGLVEDPRVQAIQEHRMWSRVNDAYYHKYLARMDADGTLRYGLMAIGTVTGRLSSSNINIQAVPRETDRYKVKDAFIARPGYVLAELDYSQAELRLAAHYSKDERLTRLMLEGADLHTATATDMNIPRSRAKNVNFSAWYNIGPKKFSETYNVPLADAKVWLARYHQLHPGIRVLTRSAEAYAEQHGYIRMYTGRVRHFNSVTASTYTASNALIQGGVAEMIRVAILRIAHEIPDIRILAPVHDSILMEVPDDEFTLARIRHARRIMQEQEWCSMPMVVDTKYGKRWGSTMSKIPRASDGIPGSVMTRTTDPSIERNAV